MDMENEPYTTRQTTYSNASAASIKCPLEYAVERAKLLFGCYRRGDANDPDVYVTAITAVLSRYSAEVVRTVTDPFGGLPSRKSESGWTGMPDVADVKAACETEAARVDRLAKMAALPSLQPMGRLPRPVAKPGDYANVKVPANTPPFERMVRLTEVTDKRKWKYDAEGVLWVTYDMLDTPAPMVKGGKAGPKRYTDEDLERLYPKTRATEPAPHADEMDAGQG